MFTHFNEMPLAQYTFVFGTNSHGHDYSVDFPDLNLVFSGSDAQCKNAVQRLTEIYLGVSTIYLDNNITDKCIIGYEKINGCKYRTDNVYWAHPKCENEVSVSFPDNLFGFGKVEQDTRWYNEHMTDRVIIDIDKPISNEILTEILPNNMEILTTKVRRDGDPDYETTHVRIMTPSKTDFWEAMRLKIKLCNEGIADINELIHSMYKNIYRILFSEKLEITWKEISHHYEEDYYDNSIFKNISVQFKPFRYDKLARTVLPKPIKLGHVRVGIDSNGNVIYIRIPEISPRIYVNTGTSLYEQLLVLKTSW